MSGSHYGWKPKFRKRCMKEIITFLDLTLSFIDSSTRGELLFQLHFWVFWLAIMYTILFGKRLMLQLGILTSLIVLIMFWLFDGCILTRLEHHYKKTKDTVVDVFLDFFRVKITRENQYLITISGISMITLFLISIYIRECIVGITCAYVE